MSKRLIKYTASFDNFDKSLIVLSATSGGISIGSFSTVLEVPVGIASVRFGLVFSMSTGILKTLLKRAKNNKKKHNKLLCWLEVN